MWTWCIAEYEVEAFTVFIGVLREKLSPSGDRGIAQGAKHSCLDIRCVYNVWHERRTAIQNQCRGGFQP